MIESTTTEELDQMMAEAEACVFWADAIQKAVEHSSDFDSHAHLAAANVLSERVLELGQRQCMLLKLMDKEIREG